MRIAVTGANGFVGRRVIALGRAAGLDMLPLVRRPVADMPDAAVIGDLGGADGRPRADLACDALVHLAAAAGPAGTDADAFFTRSNVTGTGSALSLAHASGAGRFIYVSSIKAVAERSLPGQPITEDSLAAPEDAYGRSKLAAEALVREQAEAGGMPALILRPPLVYGPGAGGNFRLLVRLVERGLPLPFGAIDNRRSWVFVDNLAEAMLAAAQTAAVASGSRLYHVCDPSPCSTPALIRMIADAVQRPARLLPLPVALLDLAGRLTGQSGKIQRLIGDLDVDGRKIVADGVWRPRYDTATGIGLALNPAADSAKSQVFAPKVSP